MIPEDNLAFTRPDFNRQMDFDHPFIEKVGRRMRILARIIHEGFYCNRELSGQRQVAKTSARKHGSFL